MATIESSRLEEIARAVADELQLTDDSISVSQVTVAVTYSVTRQDDFIDEWYESYLARMAEEIEVPF